MATIQELMQVHHHTKLKSLLDKFKDAKKMADGGKIDPLAFDLGEPAGPDPSGGINDGAGDEEDSTDIMLAKKKAEANRSPASNEAGILSRFKAGITKSPISDAAVDQAIDEELSRQAGEPSIDDQLSNTKRIVDAARKRLPKVDNEPKVENKLPEPAISDADIAARQARQNMSPAEKQGFELVPKDDYSLRDNPEAPELDPAHIRASRAAARNPLTTPNTRDVALPETGAIPTSEPYNPIQLPEPITPKPQGQLPSPEMGVKVLPKVLGQGIKSPVAPENITDAELVPSGLAKLAPAALAGAGAIITNPLMLGAMTSNFANPKAVPEAMAAYAEKHKNDVNMPEGQLPPDLASLQENKSTLPSKEDQINQELAGIKSDTTGMGPDGKPLGPVDPDKSLIDQDPFPSSSDTTPSTTPPEVPKSYTQQLMEAFKGIQDSHGAELRDAQALSNKNEFYTNLMKGVNQMNSGITAMGSHGIVAPAKVDNSTLDSLLKSARNPEKMYEDKVANEKFDAKSPYSMALKQALAPIMEKAGISAEQLAGMNGASLEKVAPWITAQVKAKEMAKYNNTFKQMAADDRHTRINNTLENQVNSRFDKDTTNEQNRLQAAQRVSELIDAVKGGQLIGSSQIRNAITGDLNTLQMPIGTRATMTDRQKSAINTFSTKMNELESFVNSHPNQTIPPKYITQLEAENNIFKESYAKALQTKTKSLYSGTSNPDAKKVLENRYSDFVKGYGLNPDLNGDPLEGSKLQHQPKIISQEKLLKYSKEHNMTPENAQAWLKQNGYTVDQ